MSKKRSRTKDKKKKKTITSTEKGRLVEKIVALLHETPHVKIERNVYLTPRRREIDILLSTSVAGYPVRIAIECKNEINRIGVSKIDAFVGKLKDVGIPLTHGIYVSASGYTKGGIARACEAGIRPLELRGLSQNQLEVAIEEAFESIIYLLLKIKQIAVFNKPQDIEEGLLFYDAQKRVCSSVPHLIWHMWLHNEISTTLGEHDFFSLKIPHGWYRLVNGELSREDTIGVIVEVNALVLTIKGNATNYQLKNAQTEQIERTRIELSFPIKILQYPVKVFDKEEELVSYLQSHKGMKLTIGRIKTPRIIAGAAYWPPSERAIQKLLECERKGQETSFQGIEGENLGVAWEVPQWPGAQYKPQTIGS